MASGRFLLGALLVLLGSSTSAEEVNVAMPETVTASSEPPAATTIANRTSAPFTTVDTATADAAITLEAEPPRQEGISPLRRPPTKRIRVRMNDEEILQFEVAYDNRTCMAQDAVMEILIVNENLKKTNSSYFVINLPMDRDSFLGSFSTALLIEGTENKYFNDVTPLPVLGTGAGKFHIRLDMKEGVVYFKEIDAMLPTGIYKTRGMYRLRDQGIRDGETAKVTLENVPEHCNVSVVALKNFEEAKKSEDRLESVGYVRLIAYPFIVAYCIFLPFVLSWKGYQQVKKYSAKFKKNEEDEEWLWPDKLSEIEKKMKKIQKEAEVVGG